MGANRSGPTSSGMSHKDIGERVKEIRKAAGLGQEEAISRAKDAGLVGLDQTALSRVEAGTRALKYFEAVCLAGVFGVPAEAFAFENPEKDSAVWAAQAAVTRAVRAAEEARSVLDQLARASAEADALLGEAADGLGLYADGLQHLREPLDATLVEIGVIWEEIKR